MILRGLPVVGPLDAWVQCAERLPLDDVVAMGDALLGEWSPWAAARGQPTERLESAVRLRAGCRGVATLRDALGLVRPKVKSPQETRLRLLLAGAGIREAEINEDVEDDEGRWIGRPDLVFRDVRVAIEYEGDHHRVDRTTFETDIERRERFADAGWHMIRVTRADLYERPTNLVERVRRRVG